MKRMNFHPATACFALSVVLRVTFEISKIGFLLKLSAGLMLLLFAVCAVALLKKREYAPAFDLKNKPVQRFFSYILSFGLFADFVCCGVNLYNHIQSANANLVLGAILISFRGLLSLLASVNMIIVSLSFSSIVDYDFRKLSVINLSLLAWSLCGGVMLLMGVERSYSLDNIVYYITVLLCVLSCYFYTAEIERTEAASPIGLFVCQIFGYVSLYNFVLFLCKGQITGELFAHSCVMLTLGMFMLSFVFDILHRTRKD